MGVASMYVASQAQMRAGTAGYEFVATQNFAANTITFSGLSGTYLYDILVEATNGGGAGPAISIYANGDTTITNYYRQLIRANNATITTTRANQAVLCAGNASDKTYVKIQCFRDTNSGFFCAQAVSNQAQGASLNNDTGIVCSTADIAANISSLTISADNPLTGKATLYRTYIG